MSISDQLRSLRITIEPDVHHDDNNNNKSIKIIDNDNSDIVKRVTYVNKSREITIANLSGGYNEISVRELPINSDSKTTNANSDKKTAVVEPQNIVMMMLDVSGSMFDSPFAGSLSTIHVLMREMQRIAQRELERGNLVVLILWAADSAYHHVTRENIATIFSTSIDPEVVKKSLGRPSTNEFREKTWWGMTLPRLGIERMQEVLMDYAGVPIESVTIMFATDGQFTTPSISLVIPAERLLSDAFLRDTTQFLINQNINVNMVYMGIRNDHVPDAHRIMSVFPVTRYLYCATRDDIVRNGAQLDTMLDERFNVRTISIEIDGKKSALTLSADRHMIRADEVRVVTGPDVIVLRSDSERPDEFILARRDIFSVYETLLTLKDAYFRTETIGDQLIACDTRLSEIDRRVGKMRSDGSERNRTRVYLYSVVRFKNQLQQYAAKQGHKEDLLNMRLVLSKQQDLVMTMNDKFSISIAKCVTRNRARREDYTVAHNMNVTKDDEKRRDFQTTVTFTPSRRVMEYSTLAVPAALAESEETDPISVESYADIFAAGDTLGQAGLIVKKPSEQNFHTPSTVHVKAALVTMSLQTFYDAVEQRVETTGYDSLFTAPFAGMSSEDRYNIVLPTWSPNLSFQARYRLRPLLGAASARLAGCRQTERRQSCKRGDDHRCTEN